jgi:hypothetical protein
VTMSGDASEKRNLFAEPREQTAAYVASDLGVVRVDLAPDRIGEFSLVERCAATAVAASGSIVAAGTESAVLVDTGDGFQASGFGPAVAVGVDGTTVVAAGPDGEVCQIDCSSAADWERGESADDRPDWEYTGTTQNCRRFDGRLLGAEGGIYWVRDDGELEWVGIGLEGVRDVSSTGPFAATDDGLYRYGGEEWHREHDGDASIVASDGQRVHAIDRDGLLERTVDRSGRAGDRERSSGAEGWERRTLPDGTQPVDLAYGASLCAVTDDGEFLVAPAGEQATDGQGGWRSRSIGVRGVSGLAVGPSRE